MATHGVSFESQVTAWVRETRQRMEAVFKESVQRVVSDMQTPVADGGNMPVDTGFLRASLRMTVDAPLPLTGGQPKEGTKYTYSPAAVSLVIAGADLGDRLFASYTANYASVVHYGREGKPGRQWVTMAAQRWPQIVSAVAAELQSRASQPLSEGG